LLPPTGVGRPVWGGEDGQGSTEDSVVAGCISGLDVPADRYRAAVDLVTSRHRRRLRACVWTGSGGDDSVTAAGFGLVERDICSPDQLVGVARGPGRAACAHGHRNLVIAEFERFIGHRQPDPLGQRADTIQVGLGQKDKERLAAPPADDIFLALESPGELPQDVIAAVVSFGVVDSLEVVDVDNDHSQRAVVAACGAVDLAEPFFAVAAVVQPGEGIGSAHQVELGAAISELVLQLFGPHRGADTGDELCGFERLFQVVVGAGSQPGDDVVGPGHAGEEHGLVGP
jgi:hypothetical protein